MQRLTRAEIDFLVKRYGVRDNMRPVFNSYLVKVCDLAEATSACECLLRNHPQIFYGKSK